MLKLYMEYQLRPVSTACGLDRLGTGLKTAKDWVRPTKTGSLRLRSSLLCFPNLEDRSRSRSFKFGPKDRTGLDFKALGGADGERNDVGMHRDSSLVSQRCPQQLLSTCSGPTAQGRT